MVQYVHEVPFQRAQGCGIGDLGANDFAGPQAESAEQMRVFKNEDSFSRKKRARTARSDDDLEYIPSNPASYNAYAPTEGLGDQTIGPRARRRKGVRWAPDTDIDLIEPTQHVTTDPSHRVGVLGGESDRGPDSARDRSEYLSKPTGQGLSALVQQAEDQEGSIPAFHKNLRRRLFENGPGSSRTSVMQMKLRDDLEDIDESVSGLSLIGTTTMASPITPRRKKQITSHPSSDNELAVDETRNGEGGNRKHLARSEKRRKEISDSEEDVHSGSS